VRLRLGPLRGGVLGRLRADLVRLLLGALVHPHALGLGLGAALLGVALGVGAHLRGRLLGELTVLIRGAARLLAKVLGLLLGQAQDLLDPGTEARVGGL
jgi:hypothetical protein